MNNIEIQEISSKSDSKDFIYLPEKLHKDHPNWVPPIYREEWNYFNKKKNHAFVYCSTVIVLAKRNGQAVGRIMGIINHRYNEEKNEKLARFSFFDCINDPFVSGQLLGYVENWATEKGMKKIIGPMGMYYHDPIGFMIEGFNEKPSFSANFNFEYIIQLLQSYGYTSEADLLVYKLKIPEVFPDFYIRIQQWSLRNKNLRLAEISCKKDMRKYIYPLLNLMNETYKDIFGYSRLDEEEMQELANHFIPLLDPRFLIIVTYNEDVAGFIVALPSINEGIIAARGRLFPFGFLKILKAASRSKQLDLLIGAVKGKYQGKGIDVLMGIKIMEAARKLGFTTIDSHLELESNLKVRAEMEKMGGVVNKKYRIFSKKLI